MGVNGLIRTGFSQYSPLPFSYEASSRQFRVGDDLVSLNKFAEYVAPAREPISEDAAEELVNSAELLLGAFDRLYQMPSMYKWLTSLTAEQTGQVSDSVADVMIDAYADLSDMNPQQLLKGSHWGFGVSMYRPGHPVFNVLGDCACFGVDPHGMYFGEDAWREGFSEYSMHNVDWPAQSTSLMAGAGALAYICATDNFDNS